MASRSVSQQAEAEQRSRFQLDDNVRGVMIVVIGSIALVGAAYGVMTAITGPDGWATRVANSAMAGESTAEATSYELVE